MKVLFLTRSLEWGGAERQLATLAVHLSKRGHEVVILAFYSKPYLLEGFEDSNVRVLSAEKRGRWDIVGFVCRLVRLVLRERADIVHSYLGTPNIVASLLSPFISGRVVWGIRSAFMDLNEYDWLARAAARVEAWLSGIAVLIICNSTSGKEVCIERGFPADRIRVIPNGIDTVKFRFSEALRIRVRREWQISDDTLLIGLVGRQDPMKDIDTFLSAAVIAGTDQPQLAYVLIGRGLERFDEAAPGVIGLGAQADMQAVYSALDVLCSSSKGEGFSNVIAEAMACSRPCVVTDVGDSAWIVGDSGLVVPPGNALEMSRALVRIAASDIEALGGIARSRIVQLFTIEKMVDSTESALLEIVNK